MHISLAVLAIPALSAGSIPGLSFVMEVATAVSLLIGGPLAIRAQRRSGRADPWRIVTAWGLLAAALAIVYAVVVMAVL